ncbi:MAG: HU family DNA-binding protein [Mariprofundaceae bacterium]|nr:HU family DNA-binding protein [Mariprofundaceae bacterium]
MNKAELINHVATEASVNKTIAASAVDAVLGGITGSLAKGDPVSLVGFGVFSIAERAARTARNPRTGEPIQVAASKSPKFKAGKSLKDAVK